MGFESKPRILIYLQAKLSSFTFNEYSMFRCKLDAKKDSKAIGYEALLLEFKEVQGRTPKGVSLKRNRNTIVLSFKIGDNSLSNYGCSESFTQSGMYNALTKAHKVAEKLKIFTSEIELWEWYDKEIREKNKITNDLITFGEAIAKVEKDFWKRPRRFNKNVEKNSPSVLRWG